MSQYTDKVERQRLLLEAEEWALGFKALHHHSLNSMWYDNRPQDTEGGKHVTDVQYNSGLIKRTLEDGTEIWFGRKLRGDDLISAYQRGVAMSPDVAIFVDKD